MNKTTTEPKCDSCGSTRDVQPETFYFTMSTNDGGTFQEAETQDLCGRCRSLPGDDHFVDGWMDMNEDGTLPQEV